MSVPTIFAPESVVQCIRASEPSAPAPALENPTSIPIGKLASGNKALRSLPGTPACLRRKFRAAEKMIVNPNSNSRRLSRPWVCKRFKSKVPTSAPGSPPAKSRPRTR